MAKDESMLTQYTPPNCLDLAANLTVELNDLKIIPSNYLSSIVILQRLMESNW